MENLHVDPARVNAFFIEHGYAVVENLIPQTIIDDIYTFLLRQTGDAVDAAQQELQCGSTMELVDIAGQIAAGHRGASALSALSKTTRDTLTGHFPLAVRLSDKLWQIPLSAGALDILRACLNSERIFMHMPPTARFVLAQNNHAGVPPHQDASYNGHMNAFMTMWVPLVDITDECGGVIVYEGSGKSHVMDAPDSQNSYWRNPVETQNYSPKHIKIKARDVLLLNPNIIHGSAPNTSDRTRISIDFRIFGEQGSSLKHYLDLQTTRIFEPKTSVQ
ncbi:MAG TPA: phytanoyl-CoA dioxygenase family protein [Herbaspirillum sp.]|jgi:ectoine hydroxylase-related dioxygenase (phytanoyl-CoA dioxygenase family)|nr:phytanoyl-CoA dioxygenase family protein [Herbaspirillum sp.]